LLKILSRITDPTAGEIMIKGRVSALLEVGTGFHPELTGRENVFMNGTILGMTKKEIDLKFDEIIDFSGIEKHIDTPVKFYSSGMKVRLAFAVAAHLEPELLIIDEVLAVGDAEFQKKCLGKMEDVAGQGRTVLFVSHNLEALKNLCPKSILLDHGLISTIGETKQVVNVYLSKNENPIQEKIFWNLEDAPGNEFVKVKSIRLEYQGKNIDIKTPFSIIIEFWNNVDALTTNISLHLLSNTGETVFNVFSELNPPPVLQTGLCQAQCLIPGNLLNYGTYTLKFFIVKDKSIPLFRMDNILKIEVLDRREEMDWYGEIPGLVRPKLNFTIENV
jgi:lipopolysaccharide transport system ATP-binding protein